jgi:glycosyltransferase EpsD
MPFNVIEAMGCGKPILASRIKGHTDLIEDGKEGFLYDLDDLDGFVDSVVKIYDGTLRTDPSHALAKYAEYSRERVFDETLDVIKRSLVE